MVRVFLKLKALYLKTEMEYTANFWMMLFSGIVMRAVMLAVPFVIYRNIPSIAGWSEYEVYFILSFAFVTEGLCQLFFEGIWKIPQMVFAGTLDVILSRPCSPLLQVLGSSINLQGISTFAMGVLCMLVSLKGMGRMNGRTALLCLFFTVCGTLIRLSVYIITNSAVFWFESDGSNNVPYIANGIGDYAKYPIDIYPKWMQFILLFVLPYGFIGFVPAVTVRGEHTAGLMAAMTVVCAAFLAAARWVFYRGIKGYESVGM